MARILDPNINRIKFFNSTTAGAVPAGGDLVRGELAFNLTDRTIFSHNGSTIVELGFGKGGNVNGNISTTGTITATNNIKSNAKVLSETGLSISSDSGDGRGVALYGDIYDTTITNLPSYGLAFAKSTPFGGHGVVSSTDWATYFTMTGGDNRGWIFKNLSITGGNTTKGNVASISSMGIATFSKVVAPIEGNADTSTRLSQTQHVLSSEVGQWYKIATVSQPQMGVTTYIDMIGGVGFNAQEYQMVSSRVIFKTSNGNPNYASAKIETIDGSYNQTQAVAWKDMGNNVYEIFVWFGSYWTGYIVPNYSNAVAWYDKGFAPFGGSLDVAPTNGVLGWVDIVAKLNSNVASATKLKTPRTLNGVEFDGTKNINIPDNFSVRLTPGTNLNDVLTPGKYYMDYDSEALTITNKPIEGSFSLEVLKTAGEIQRFTHYMSARTWVRKTYLGVGPWREIVLNDQNNFFKASQTIDAIGDSVIQMNGTNEAAVVLQKPGRRAVLTIPTDNSVGLMADNNWLFNSPSANKLNFHSNTYFLNGTIFSLLGVEGDNITRVQNQVGAITVNSPESGMASIFNALNFNWYGDHFQVGAIRGGSTNSHGFGVTKGNSDLLFRVSPTGDTYTKSAVVSQSGMFKSDNWHYVDVGSDGRNILSLGSYGGSFDFINTNGTTPIFSIRRDAVNTNMPIWPTASLAYSPTIDTIETTAGIRNAPVSVPDNGAKYKSFIHGSMQSLSGYRTHASFGVSKRSVDWSQAGAVIAVGGADVAPTSAFYFDNESWLRTSSGILRTETFSASSNTYIGGDLIINNSIRTDAPYIQVLTMDGQARGIATGGVLASTIYSDWSKVPTAGIYSAGDIRTPLWIYGAKIITDTAQVNASVDVANAPGGGTTNGLRSGNMDAALYSGCNIDIQTHNGLGIMDQTGTRRIVFESRAGTMHCQGNINANNLNANAQVSAQGNITTNANIFAAGNITAFSDRRLKENIKSITNPIDRVKNLNGVTYTRNDLEDKNRVHAGLIAQDVQSAMPESVIETENGILTVDYSSIIGLLVETIKDLNKRIEILEK